MDQSQHQVVQESCRELQILARRRPGVQAVMRNLLLRYAERPGFPLRGRRSLQREFTLLTFGQISDRPSIATVLSRVLTEYPWEDDARTIGCEVERLAETLGTAAEKFREAAVREPLAANVILEQLAANMLEHEEGPDRLPVETFRVFLGAIISVKETGAGEAIVKGVGEALRLMKTTSRNTPMKGGFQAWHFTAAFLGLTEQSPEFQRFQNGWITRNDF